MKTGASLALIGSLLFVAGADAKLCQFGYADAVIVGDTTTLGWVDARNAGVPQDSGRRGFVVACGAILEVMG